MCVCVCVCVCVIVYDTETSALGQPWSELARCATERTEQQILNRLNAQVRMRAQHEIVNSTSSSYAGQIRMSEYGM
jgi:aminoglycoside phosphotransferase (APT) family kinase protein